MIQYKIVMEFEGLLAMWARPDTDSNPIFYPIPTWSAAKGVFEPIGFFANGEAWTNLIRVESVSQNKQKHWRITVPKIANAAFLETRSNTEL